MVAKSNLPPYPQYEHFAARRRALLEAEGTGFIVRAMEEATKTLSKPKKDQ